MRLLSADRCYSNDPHCDNGWCLLTKTQCRSSSRCPRSFWCDGYTDCPDKSDEAHCNISGLSTTVPPSSKMFCIRISAKTFYLRTGEFDVYNLLRIFIIKLGQQSHRNVTWNWWHGFFLFSFFLQWKAVLFRSYCVNMYDTALWHSFTARTINRLHSWYHKCMKHLFGYSRHYSVCNMLLELNLPSFDTLLINSSAVFNKNWL